MKTGACFFLAAALAMLASPAPAAESFSELFTEGEFGLSFRYRFEYVDQDSFVEEAEASTLRGRINFGTGVWNGFSAFAEFDYVANVFWDDYNAGGGNTPENGHLPTVVDPTGPDWNQAYLDWTSQQGTKLRGGRQRIILDNQRFVGAVGWRQNEQTFDAGYFNTRLGKVDVQLGYIWQVNKIFGDDVPAGQEDHNTSLVNASREWTGRGKLVGYFYDIDNQDNPVVSSRSVGLRWEGATNLRKRALKYSLEYAHQKDGHNQPVDYSANYYRVDATLEFTHASPTLGFESLGGDDSRSGAAFQTPLATLHGFNGWADKFLTTPAAGLNDLFLGLKGPLGKWTWNVVYHDFAAESGGASYGQELDASISRKFGERYGLLFKGARFNASSGQSLDDVTKLWLQFTADF